MELDESMAELLGTETEYQVTNYKWFDRLTTLSPAEGQYPNSNHQ